jgi:hypothetical protein
LSLFTRPLSNFVRGTSVTYSDPTQRVYHREHSMIFHHATRPREPSTTCRQRRERRERQVTENPRSEFENRRIGELDSLRMLSERPRWVGERLAGTREPPEHQRRTGGGVQSIFFFNAHCFTVPNGIFVCSATSFSVRWWHSPRGAGRPDRITRGVSSSQKLNT